MRKYKPILILKNNFLKLKKHHYIFLLKSFFSFKNIIFKVFIVNSYKKLIFLFLIIENNSKNRNGMVPKFPIFDNVQLIFLAMNEDVNSCDSSNL